VVAPITPSSSASFGALEPLGEKMVQPAVA
jgi:hypothetical protein